jgi:Caspase domain
MQFRLSLTTGEGDMIRTLLAIALALAFCAGQAARAQAPAPRIALVIGNGAYQGAGGIATAEADATIVAETMRTAGYDVTELHDVVVADFGQAIRAFLDKVYAAGPETVAFVYFGGYGAQFDGENYLVPVDARIGRYADVPSQAFRLNDLVRELAELPAAARLIVLDASRDHGFGRDTSEAVPPGLAMMDVPAGMLIAYAAAPGAVSGEIEGPYSLYSGTLVTLMRQPGLDIEQIFKATRLQVNKVSTGAQTPWSSSTLAVGLTLFEAPQVGAAEPAPQAAAPPPAPQSAAPPPAPQASVPEGTPPPPVPIPPVGRSLASVDELRRLPADEAYARVVESDMLRDYQWFVEVYPTYRLAPQIWVIIETRREAILWRRSITLNSPRAYWNYLKRYPNGTHAAEARMRLGILAAAVAPPPDYAPQPEAMPAGWWDEAVDLVEVVPRGYDAPPAVFDDLAPVYVEPPPPLFPYPVGFYPPPPYWLVPRPPPAGVVVVAPPRLGPVAMIRPPPFVRIPPPLIARRPFLIGGRLPPAAPLLRPLPAFARPPLRGVSLPSPPPGRPRLVPLSTTTQPLVTRPGIALPPSARPLAPAAPLGVARPTPPTPPSPGLATRPPPSTGIGAAKSGPLTGTGAANPAAAKEFKNKEFRKGTPSGAGTAATTPATGLPKARTPPPSAVGRPPPAAMMKTTPPPRPPPAAVRPPPRPAVAAPKAPPRRPVCRTVNGKQVCS